VGDRQTHLIPHFSPAKKILQKFGSWLVRTFSGVDVPDAVSGFRAISREAAMRLNIVSPFSYTIEMLIQVGKKGMAFTSVPIRTNAKTRDSRLFKNTFRFVERSVTTLVRMYAMYQPLRVFTSLGLLVALIGLIPMVRFLYHFIFEDGQGKIQSLVIGSSLLVIGTLTFFMGLLADLANHNRALIEMTLEKVRRIEAAQLSSGLAPPEHPAVPGKLGDGGDQQNRYERGEVGQPGKLVEAGERQVLKSPKRRRARQVVGSLASDAPAAAKHKPA